MDRLLHIAGAQAAREILDQSGLQEVPVEEVPGHLTDHYDPTKKALFLSSENYHGTSLAAVGHSPWEAKYSAMGVLAEPSKLTASDTCARAM